MKKLFLISAILILYQNSFSKNCFDKSECIECATAKCDQAGVQTFFRTRSIIEDVSIYFALTNYNNYYDNAPANQENKTHLYSTYFYQKGHKSSLKDFSIKEIGTGNANSIWGGVIAPNNSFFSSVLNLCPERKVFGTTFDTRRDFLLCNSSFWVDLKFAIYQAEHNLNPSESITSTNLGQIIGSQTALEYLNSKQLTFGKLSKCKLKKTNFDDIELKLGYSPINAREKGYHFDLYGSILFPISPEPQAYFSFEPLVGRGHWGLGLGFNTGLQILKMENDSLTAMADFSYQYLFSKKEMRMFDLKKNGQFSRFIKLTQRNNTLASFPAVNFTTFKANVTPRSIINLWTGLHYQHCSWHFEFDYNLWWKQSEKICVSKKCNPNFDELQLGVYDISGLLDFNPISASDAKIDQPIVGANAVKSNKTFKTITLNDLDLASTSHPETLTHKFSFSIGYETLFFSRNILLGLTAAFEAADPVSAIQQWGIWGTLGMDF